MAHEFAYVNGKIAPVVAGRGHDKKHGLTRMAEETP